MKKKISALATLSTTTLPKFYDDVADCCYAKEEESTMNNIAINTIPTVRDDVAFSKDHLHSRIRDHKDEVKRSFETKYIADDKPPKSAQEIVDRILAGNIKLPDTKDPTYDAWCYQWQPYLGIRWRHPDKKVDREGYDKACEALDAATEDVRTKVTVLAPVDGMKAFEAYRSANPIVS